MVKRVGQRWPNMKIDNDSLGWWASYIYNRDTKENPQFPQIKLKTTGKSRKVLRKAIYEIRTAKGWKKPKTNADLTPRQLWYRNLLRYAGGMWKLARASGASVSKKDTYREAKIKYEKKIPIPPARGAPFPKKNKKVDSELAKQVKKIYSDAKARKARKARAEAEEPEIPLMTKNQRKAMKQAIEQTKPSAPVIWGTPSADPDGIRFF